jgi:hypothetical protein
LWEFQYFLEKKISRADTLYGTKFLTPDSDSTWKTGPRRLPFIVCRSYLYRKSWDLLSFLVKTRNIFLKITRRSCQATESGFSDKNKWRTIKKILWHILTCFTNLKKSHYGIFGPYLKTLIYKRENQIFVSFLMVSRAKYIEKEVLFIGTDYLKCLSSFPRV